ncbi:hypothetical protein SAMN04515692_11355 [Leifsonia sp. CL147]|nr:hypothetical protein SAMN04515694_11355 [Leifsonia sp. CL154]SFL80881.1 hypothetical protein SAMN04515692_11355 [Leifsonia sp. CL147]
MAILASGQPDFSPEAMWVATVWWAIGAFPAISSLSNAQYLRRSKNRSYTRRVATTVGIVIVPFLVWVLYATFIYASFCRSPP